MRRFVKALVFKRDTTDTLKPSSDPPPSTASDDGHVTAKKGRKPPHSLRIKSFIPKSSSSRVPTTYSIASSPSTPQLSVNGDHAASSSASSSGSMDVSLRTPDDDRASLLPSAARDKSWNMWVVKKKTSLVNGKERADRSSPKEYPDPPSRMPHHLAELPNTPPRSFVSEARTGFYDIADERSTGFDQASTSAPHHIPAGAILRPERMTPSVARENLRLLIESKLAPIPVSYPLASSITGPLFPASCNSSVDLARKRSTRYTLFQKRLLRCVDETSSDAVSLFPLVTARRSVPKDPLASLPSHDISHPSKTLHITSYSVGIRRWICRPCFEDTHNVYVLSDEGIVPRQVSGTILGVPALDYSETLDILADPTYYTSDITRVEVPVVTIVPPTNQANSEMTLSSPPSSGPTPMSSSILVRNHVSAIPSPLRNDALSSSKRGSGSSSVGTTPPVNPVQRGVHFADDEDDALPLYLVRMKKKREEKARFLRGEQRRREIETRQAQRLAEEERRQKDLERIEREKELQERRAREEEKRQRSYLEEVTAARQRREFNRSGGSNNSSPALSPSPSSMSFRDVEHSSKSREARYSKSSSFHDSPPVSRRESSSPGSAPHSSSGSSRAPSVTGQPTDDRKGSIRPTSMHSTNSSDDVHSRSQSRRNSAMASGGLRPSSSRSTVYPVWTHNFLPPPVPPLPRMLPYMMPVDPSLSVDMPLLPPVPPFMLQQYPRRSSRHSSPGHSNSSSSRVETSANSSFERVDQIRTGYPPSPSSSQSSIFTNHSSTPRSGPSQHEPRRASMPPAMVKNDRTETLSASQSQPAAPHSRSRGRLHASQQQEQPSPWTALPTRSGTLPVAMPRAR